MFTRTVFLTLGAALCVLAAGCNSSSMPPPVVTITRAYVTNGQSGVNAGATSFFTLPLTSSSVAAGNVTTTTYPWFECVDGSGRLFSVSYGSGNVLAFTQPIANAATAAFSINLGVINSPIGCVFDSAGNMYVSETNQNRVAVIPAPVTASSVPNATYITTSVNSPYGVAVDSSSDLFVCNGTGPITEYAPLSSGNTLLHSFGGDFDNEGCVIGPDGSLYVANGTSNGEIDVYKAPFSNASAIDHSVTPPACTGIYEVKFDPAGTMYVAGHTTTQSILWAIPAPYSGAPSATVVVDAGSTNRSVGLALGP
jgi:hypothetical protein